MEKSIFERTGNMPIPLVATALSICTLGNVYDGLGFPLVRFLAMVFGVVILFFYLIKLVKFRDKCKNEYSTNTVFASLYAALTMVTMITCSYFITWIPFLKYIIILAVIIHAVLIVAFIYLKFVKNFDINFFVPSCFVTFNGIMVSTVVAMNYLPKAMTMAVLYFGIIIYTITIPFMVYRLKKFEVPKPAYHTQAILIAPCSLIVATYINATNAGYIQNPSMALLFLYYICVLLSLLFFIIRIPKFFSFDFTPGFAGLTFPMAIGVVATQKMVGFLSNNGYNNLSVYLNQLAGIQIILTTTIISFVIYNFGRLFFTKSN